MKLLLALFLSVIMIFFSKVYTKSRTQLLSVVEITRHGARTPMTFMDHSAKLYFGSRKAQLTINGMRQHILAGRWLRRRYVQGEVFPLFKNDVSDINPQEIDVISSPLQRTIFSATGHINGLFPKAIIKLKFQDRNQIKTNDVPPIEGFKIDPRDGREVKINVISKEKDYVFHADKCRRSDSNQTIFQEMNKTTLFNITQEERESAVNDIMSQYEKILMDKLDHSGQGKKKGLDKSIKKGLEKVKAYSKLHLKKLISWLRPFRYHTKMPQLISNKSLITTKKQVLNRWYEPRLFDSEGLKYTSSFIFNDILSLFESRTKNGKDRRKMVIYTGHDTNIVNALTNLLSEKYLRKRLATATTNKDNYDFLVPPLASSLLFELHKEVARNRFFVKIIYNGELIGSGFRMGKMRVKNNEIEYSDFINLLRSRVVKDLKSLKCGHSFN